MLSESSYMTALYIYLGAACAILLCLAWWLGRSWRAGWVTLVVLLGAALLLTPAYPREDADTLAPALIVAAFALLTEGPEAAEHALKPLALMSGLALAVTLVLSVTLFRRRRAAPPPAATRAESR